MGQWHRLKEKPDLRQPSSFGWLAGPVGPRMVVQDSRDAHQGCTPQGWRRGLHRAEHCYGSHLLWLLLYAIMLPSHALPSSSCYPHIALWLMHPVKPNYLPFLALFPHYSPLYHPLLPLFSVTVLPGTAWTRACLKPWSCWLAKFHLLQRE